jgi:beta-phosphoglucomutase-like phosphatase (HAD superfamily)
VIEDSPTGALAGVSAGMAVLAWPELEGLEFPTGATVVEGDIAAALLPAVLPPAAG